MCGACNYCKYMLIQRNLILPNGQTSRPRHFANCRTIWVAYMLCCDCGCFYIGKTKLEFCRRAYKHIRSMQSNNYDLPSGRHAKIVHGVKFPQIKFLILDCISTLSSRGGDWNKILLQMELRWIHNLKAKSLPGLNEATCFKSFCDGFSSGWTEK